MGKKVKMVKIGKNGKNWQQLVKIGNNW